MRDKKEITETDTLSKVARLLDAQAIDAQKRIISYLFSRVHKTDAEPEKTSAKLTAVS